MKTAAKDYIINTIFRTNILPIISECNTSCIFCSHKQNPPEVEVFRMPKLTLDQIEELMEFLSPDKKIVIGESASRIIEGEPLLHRNFAEIVELIRRRFQKTTIQVTTNGILLSEELVNHLVRLGNIELNISVNCVKPEKRQKVLGLRNDDIRNKIVLLKDRLKFSGSMVLLPEILDETDVEDVVSLLDKYGADNVRIFLPGYTSLSEKNADLHGLIRSMQRLKERLNKKYRIPVTIEPSIAEDLISCIEGVIDGGYAYSSGLRKGDVILEINGAAPLCRVDCFDTVYRLANPELVIKRADDVMKLKLEKPSRTAPGFIMLYDIDPELVNDVKRTVERYGAQHVLMLTSELAGNILKQVFNESPFEVLPVRNSFFGGNIMCAGLLTIHDIEKAVEEFLKLNARPDLILLPPVMFDYTGADLLGKRVNEIDEKFGITVEVV